MKKLEKTKYVALGMILATLTCMSVQVAFAELVTKNITVSKGVTLYIDDVKFTPKDSNGNIIEPFIYNGTTYLPVRAVGEAVDKAITWEQSTNSVYIGKHESTSPTILLNSLTPYDIYSSGSGGYTPSFINSSDSITDNMGKEYQGYMGISGMGTYSTDGPVYNIDGKYSTLKGRYILKESEKTTTYKSQVLIYGDNKQLYKSDSITKGSKPIDFTVDVSGVKELKVLFANNGGKNKFALVNAGLYQ